MLGANDGQRTKSPEVGKHVNEKKPVVRFVSRHWVETKVEILKFLVVSQAIQLLQRRHVVVISFMCQESLERSSQGQMQAV